MPKQTSQQHSSINIQDSHYFFLTIFDLKLYISIYHKILSMHIRKYNPDIDKHIIEPMMIDYFEEGDSIVISQWYNAPKEIAELLELKWDIYVMIDQTNIWEIIWFHR